MAKSSRAALKADQAVKWANNTTKNITPQRLRQPIIDCVDSVPNIVDDGRTIVRQTVAEMLAYDWTDVDTGASVDLRGYSDAGDGGGGSLRVDKADTTTAHNGVTVFVASDGTRLKRTNLKYATAKQAGAKADGSDDTAALEAATAAGLGILDLEGHTYSVSSTFDVSGSGITIIGDGAVIKSLAVVAGDSAVVSVASGDGVAFSGDITFDANGHRRWGLYIQTNATNCLIDGCDAKNFTDVLGQGFKVPDTLPITIKKTDLIQKVIVTGKNVSTASGSIPAGSYAAWVVGVDALGREGPMLLWAAANSGPIVLASPGKFDMTWNTDNNARSYRLYIGVSTTADYERYWSIPCDPTNPSTYTKEVSSGYAGKQGDVTVGTTAGAFTGQIFADHIVRVSAYYTDGANNHSGNSQFVRWATVNNTNTRVTVSWSAPAGATPTGYLLFVSTMNTGSLRNFRKVVDVGNATSYTYTGALGYTMFPFGNSDEVVSLGFNERPIGGSGKAIIPGDIFQTCAQPGDDCSHQMQRVSTDTSTAFGSAFSGIDFRLKKTTDSVPLVYWRIGQHGDSAAIRGYYNPTSKHVFSFDPTYGLALPVQPSAFAYYSATTGNVTGDSNFITLVPDTEVYDTLGNMATGTFTAPADGIYQVDTQVVFVAAATSTAAEIRVRCNSTSYASNYTENVKAGAYNSIRTTARVKAIAGDTVFVLFRVNGVGVDVPIYATAAKESYVSVHFLG